MTRCCTPRSFRFRLEFLACAALVVGLLAQPQGSLAAAEHFYVSTDGEDAAVRDGKSWATAWRSLAYACERSPEEEHVIELGPGEFIAERTARPKSGATIFGQGAGGEDATHLVAATTWPLAAAPDEGPQINAFLIALDKVRGVTIRDLRLASHPEHRINGAVHCLRSEAVTLENLHVEDFRWSGLHLELSSEVTVRYSRIVNASTDKGQFHGGAVRTRWIKHSRLHHNQILATVGRGYGYKGGGHEGVRIDHNVIDVLGEFAIESAHENEYGLEIDRNYLTRCISVPKGGQGADPNERGYEYSVWIHHNLLTDSYTVEGPRNHLRLSHNYIRIEKTGGRVYTHHGGVNQGPVWIHHNVVENLDRAFVWKNQGIARNIFVYNNTVFCGDAGDRAAPIIDTWHGDQIDNWVVKNNIFVAPQSQPRKLYQDRAGAGEKIIAANNLCIRVSGVPEGNFLDENPQLRAEGAKPWPYYEPAAATSFVVDRGVDVGLPFAGNAPDIGAGEWGLPREPFEVPRPDAADAAP